MLQTHQSRRAFFLFDLISSVLTNQNSSPSIARDDQYRPRYDRYQLALGIAVIVDDIGWQQGERSRRNLQFDRRN